MAKMRLQITKGEEIRYLSHLDYARAIERAVRRAKLPAAYSEGFNPHMKMAFASALALGVTSDTEYMDIELAQDMSGRQFTDKLSPEMPQGIVIKAAEVLKPQTPALMKVINLATYLIKVPLAGEREEAAAAVKEFNTLPVIPYTKESPKGKRNIDIKEYLAAPVEMTQGDGATVQLAVAIHITPTGSVKPGEVLDALVRTSNLPVKPEEALIHRIGLFINDGREWKTPV